jgi:hypothetical protein
VKACEHIREQFGEALYGELDAARQLLVDRHLAGCRDCAAHLAALRATLDVMSQRRRAQPDSDFWDRFAGRLDARVAADAADAANAAGDALRSRVGSSPLSFRRWSGRGGRWAWQAAAAALALVAVGIVLGRLSVSPAPEEVVTVPEAAASGPSAAPEAAPLRLRVDRYMQRSQTLLLGVVNLDADADGAASLDFAPYRRVSQELIGQAPLLERELSDAGERRLAELVAELELILLQIASLEARQDLEGVDVIREGIDRQALLFRIHLESARTRGPEEASTEQSYAG